MQVINFLIIPKYYFVPDIIEKRKPLSKNARRAGWIGCNIALSKIPETGRIYFVKQSQIISRKQVLETWSKTTFLMNFKGDKKGWILDIMNCVDSIPKDVFILDDIYSFESILKIKHPNNNYIKDKIRQQLQILRDKGFVEFLGKGKYRKVL